MVDTHSRDVGHTLALAREMHTRKIEIETQRCIFNLCSNIASNYVDQENYENLRFGPCLSNLKSI